MNPILITSVISSTKYSILLEFDQQVRIIFSESEKNSPLGRNRLNMEKIQVTCEMEVTLKMIGGKVQASYLGKFDST